MNAANPMDATFTRVIRRIITIPGMCSDSLLAVADGITQASADADDELRAVLRSHADDLRRFARYFADPAPEPARPRTTPQEAARVLVQHHSLTAADLNTALSLNPRLDAIVGALFDAAESIGDNLT